MSEQSGKTPEPFALRQRFEGEVDLLDQLAAAARHLAEQEATHRPALAKHLNEWADECDTVTGTMTKAWAKGSVFGDVPSARIRTGTPAWRLEHVDKDSIARTAEAGMRFEAVRQGVHLYDQADWRKVAWAAVLHAANAGLIVTIDDHARSIEEHQAETARWKHSWALACAELDKVRCDAQRDEASA